MFREKKFFFLGYRLCYKTPWHTSNWSRIRWKRWNKNIYIFIFLEFSWQDPWGKVGKLDTKHYSPLPHENEFETLKIFFFFFILVRETNRAMYNLQVETETRTNQYQFPVYFGPKLQPKKNNNPFLSILFGGRNFMERQFCVERCETFKAVPEAQRLLSTGSVSTYWPLPLL